MLLYQVMFTIGHFVRMEICTVEVACKEEYVKWITYDMPVLKMYIIATHAECETIIYLQITFSSYVHNKQCCM